MCTKKTDRSAARLGNDHRNKGRVWMSEFSVARLTVYNLRMIGSNRCSSCRVWLVRCNFEARLKSCWAHGHSGIQSDAQLDQAVCIRSTNQYALHASPWFYFCRCLSNMVPGRQSSTTVDLGGEKAPHCQVGNCDFFFFEKDTSNVSHI